MGVIMIWHLFDTSLSAFWAFSTSSCIDGAKPQVGSPAESRNKKNWPLEHHQINGATKFEHWNWISLVQLKQKTTSDGQQKNLTE